MIVQPRRHIAAEHTQTAGHAEMHDDRAGIEAQQDVFCTALDAPHDFTLDFGFEAARNRPAQASIAHDDSGDAPTQEGGSDALTRRFDFGQFGQPTPT